LPLSLVIKELLLDAGIESLFDLARYGAEYRNQATADGLAVFSASVEKTA
jgi:hypothetical protein